MNNRERFVACLLGEPVDRPPYWIFWEPWGRTTWDRWGREGKPGAIKDTETLRTALNSDQVPREVPVNCGPCPQFESIVVEESEDFVVRIGNWGIKCRDRKHGMSMPQFLEHPVKHRKDWQRFKEERLDPHDPQRLCGDWREKCAEWMSRGDPIQLGAYPDVGLFGTLRWLLGAERCLMAFHTMPDLVREIMDHMTTLYLTVFEKVVREVRVDVIHLWEDMCYRNGPLISPKHWDEFLGPNYRRIKRFAERHSIPLLSVDTDGNPALIIPSMMRAGVNFLFPSEVAAGCDVNLLRETYPSLGLMGGVDKRALARDTRAIDQELARIRPAVLSGRYILELDHPIPDDVSWENYCYYAKALRELVCG